jgi:hypothetical protein
VILVEAQNQRSINKLRKKKTGCSGRLGQAKASCVAENGVDNRFLPRGGFCVFSTRE